MAISRKKITTVTTTEEEYNDDSNLDSVDTPSSNREPESQDNTSKANETGGMNVHNSIAQTAPKEVNGFETQVGKTWGDVFYAIFVSNNTWANLIVVLLIYGGTFYVVVKTYNQCDLLTSFKWLFMPLIIATLITIVYFIIRWIMKKWK